MPYNILISRAMMPSMKRREKMIKNSKQNWEVGQIVKVGFMAGLKVICKNPTPGDWMPDEYILERDGKKYKFVHHNGLSAI